MAESKLIPPPLTANLSVLVKKTIDPLANKQMENIIQVREVEDEEKDEEITGSIGARQENNSKQTVRQF